MFGNLSSQLTASRYGFEFHFSPSISNSSPLDSANTVARNLRPLEMKIKYHFASEALSFYVSSEVDFIKFISNSIRYMMLFVKLFSATKGKIVSKSRENDLIWNLNN